MMFSYRAAGFVILVVLIGGAVLGFVTRYDVGQPVRRQLVQTVGPGVLGTLRSTAGYQSLEQQAGRGTVSSDTKISPDIYQNVQYQYSGTKFVVPDAPVLKRISKLTPLELSDRLASNGVISLDAFGKLQTENVSLIDEDQRFLVSLDYRTGNMSISQYFKDGVDPVPDRLTTTTLSVTTNDQSAILNSAKAFVQRIGIDLQQFGTPVMQDQFQTMRPILFDGGDRTMSSIVTVIFPWQVNGYPVYDESGFPYGMSVSVETVSHEVTAAYNLLPPSFESSEYELENDPEILLDLVKQGGLYSWYMDPAAPTKTVAVGEPTPGYMLSFYQLKKTTSEHLVPALFFPITDSVQAGVIGRQTISVPLVKELIEQAKTSQGGGGVVEPAPAATTPVEDLSAPGSGLR